jgi:hypothetical protein
MHDSGAAAEKDPCVTARCDGQTWFARRGSSRLTRAEHEFKEQRLQFLITAQSELELAHLWIKREQFAFERVPCRSVTVEWQPRIKMMYQVIRVSTVHDIH